MNCWHILKWKLTPNPGGAHPVYRGVFGDERATRKGAVKLADEYEKKYPDCIFTVTQHKEEER